MVSERTELFKVDAKTVDVDPASGLLIAKGMDGETKYRFWGLASSILYPSAANNQGSYDYIKDGILGLESITVEDVRREFLRYRQQQLQRSNELELGVAAIPSLASPGFEYLHKDLGIWEKVPEARITSRSRSTQPRRFPMVERLRIWNELTKEVEEKFKPK